LVVSAHICSAEISTKKLAKKKRIIVIWQSYSK